MLSLPSSRAPFVKTGGAVHAQGEAPGQGPLVFPMELGGGGSQKGHPLLAPSPSFLPPFQPAFLSLALSNAALPSFDSLINEPQQSAKSGESLALDGNVCFSPHFPSASPACGQILYLKEGSAVIRVQGSPPTCHWQKGTTEGNYIGGRLARAIGRLLSQLRSASDSM